METENHTMLVMNISLFALYFNPTLMQNVFNFVAVYSNERTPQNDRCLQKTCQSDMGRVVRNGRLRPYQGLVRRITFINVQLIAFIGESKKM